MNEVLWANSPDSRSVLFLTKGKRGVTEILIKNNLYLFKKGIILSNVVILYLNLLTQKTSVSPLSLLFIIILS